MDKENGLAKSQGFLGKGESDTNILRNGAARFNDASNDSDDGDGEHGALPAELLVDEGGRHVAKHDAASGEEYQTPAMRGRAADERAQRTEGMRSKSAQSAELLPRLDSPCCSKTGAVTLL